MMIEKEHRITWVDQCKGFAIVMMVFGHCWSRNMIATEWINSFHMPLFFCISGYLMMVKGTRFSSDWIFRQLKRLLIPYFIFSFSFAGMIFALQIVGGVATWNDFTNEAVSIICLAANSPTWFLPCLFFAQCFWLIFDKTLKGIGVLRNFLIILCLLGVLWWNVQDTHILVLRVLLAVIYIEAGRIYYFLSICRKPSIVFSCVCLTVNIVLCIYGCSVEMMTLSFKGNELLAVLNGVFGSVGVMEVFRKNNKTSEKIGFFGRNSMGVLCTHMFAIEILRLVDYKIFNGMIGSLYYLEGYVLTILVLLIVVPSVKIINKHVPFLQGKMLIERSDRIA